MYNVEQEGNDAMPPTVPLPLITTSSILAVLQQAQARLQSEGGWAQHADARDAQGCEVAIDSPTAVAWCAVSAIRAVAGTHDLSFAALRAVARHIRPRDTDRVAAVIIYWNDTPDRTLKDVLAMFDRAIASVRRRRLIEATLRQARGNRTRAARALGLQRTYLLRLIRNLNVVARDAVHH